MAGWFSSPVGFNSCVHDVVNVWLKTLAEPDVRRVLEVPFLSQVGRLEPVKGTRHRYWNVRKNGPDQYQKS
jgi:hypothetical protein